MGDDIMIMMHTFLSRRVSVALNSRVVQMCLSGLDGQAGTKQILIKRAGARNKTVAHRQIVVTFA